MIPQTPKTRQPFKSRPFPLDTIPTEPEMQWPNRDVPSSVKIYKDIKHSSIKDKIKFFDDISKQSSKNNMKPVFVAPIFDNLTVDVDITKKKPTIETMPLLIPNCGDLYKNKYFQCQNTKCSNFSELVILRYSVINAFIINSKVKKTVNKLYKNLLSKEKNNTDFPTSFNTTDNKGIKTISNVLQKGNRDINIYPIIDKVFTYPNDVDLTDYYDEHYTDVVKFIVKDNLLNAEYTLQAQPFKVRISDLSFETFVQLEIGPALEDLIDFFERDDIFCDSFIIEIKMNNKCVIKMPIMVCNGISIYIDSYGAKVLGDQVLYSNMFSRSYGSRELSKELGELIDKMSKKESTNVKKSKFEVIISSIAIINKD